MSHLGKESELNGLEALDELQINIDATSHKTKSREKASDLSPLQKAMPITQSMPSTRTPKNQVEANKKSARFNSNNNSGQTNFNSNNKNAKEDNNHNANNQMTANPELSTHPVRRVADQTTPQRNAFLEPKRQLDHLLKTNVKESEPTAKHKN